MFCIFRQGIVLPSLSKWYLGVTYLQGQSPTAWRIPPQGAAMPGWQPTAWCACVRVVKKDTTPPVTGGNNTSVTWRRDRVRSTSTVSFHPTGPVCLAPRLTQVSTNHCCATGGFFPSRNHYSSGVPCAHTLSRTKKHTSNPEQGRDSQTRKYAQHRLWRAYYLHIRKWSRPKAHSYATLQGSAGCAWLPSPNPSFIGKWARQCNLLLTKEVKEI